MTSQTEDGADRGSTGPAPASTIVPEQQLTLQGVVTAAVLTVSIGLLILSTSIAAVNFRLGTGSGLKLIIVVALGFVMGHGSLVGIWWTRSRWPSHLKTLLAVCAAAGLWVLIIYMLDTAEFRSAAGAGWAASLGTQVASTMLLTSLLEAIANPAVLQRRHRFSIFFLLIWTTVIAVMLGVGRRIAEGLGWSAAVLLGWEYFLQLQMVAGLNAALGGSVLASFQLLSRWRLRLLAASAVSVAIALVGPLVLLWMFTNVGASYFEMVGLLMVQAVVVLGVLVPLQLAGGLVRPP